MRFLATVLHRSLLTLALCLAGTGSIRGAPQRNVLLITVDTLRADHLPVYGYDQIRTPNISRLADRGAVFEHVVSPTPLTLPSHASILTGVYPVYHGVRDNAGFVLGEDQLTLAELLSDAGYATGAFVGSFVLDSRTGLDQSFDTYFADFPLTDRTVVSPGAIQRRASEVAGKAIDWMKRQSDLGRPFFAWVHFYDPHAPYEPPQPFARRYRSHPYDGEIAYVDSVLGDVMAFVESRDLDSRTLIILTSDHGESLGEHQEQTHGFYIYESTQRVPLIWVMPDGRFSGRRIGGTVRLVDIAPTILQMLNIRPPRLMQGRSLLRSLLGKEDEPRAAYAETYYPRLQFAWARLSSLYRHPYKYIDAPRPELYDLEQDPQETRNLYDENQSLAHSLRDRLTDFVSRHSGGPSAPNRPVDRELSEALASLGYLTLSSGRMLRDDSPENLPDPKDKIGIYKRMTRASELMHAGNFSDAVVSLRQILEDDPSATFVFQSLGMAYSQMGDYRKALEAFQEAAVAFPDDPPLLFNLGNAHARLQQWDAAEDAFEKVIDLDPGHFRARSNVATIWLQEGGFSKALQACQEILKAHPSYEPALFNAALASDALKEPDQAVTYLKRVIQSNPSNVRAYVHLSRILEAQGETDQARDYLAKARSLQSSQRH